MDLHLLVQHLEPVQDDWFSLGLYLSVELDMIHEIEAESSDVKVCQEKLLKFWIIQNPSGSWEDIITALNKLGKTELEKNLREKFTTMKPEEFYEDLAGPSDLPPVVSASPHPAHSFKPSAVPKDDDFDDNIYGASDVIDIPKHPSLSVPTPSLPPPKTPSPALPPRGAPSPHGLPPPSLPPRQPISKTKTPAPAPPIDDEVYENMVAQMKKMYDDVVAGGDGPEETYDDVMVQGGRVMEEQYEDDDEFHVNVELAHPPRIGGIHASSFQLTSDAIIQVYDDSLRASKKREEELQEKLDAAQRANQEKDQQCSTLEDAMYDMQKKMVSSTDDYEQQQELLEKLQQKATLSKLAVDKGFQVESLTDAILVASKEEHQELLRVLEQTKRMCYARDLQISVLESDIQLMQEKFDKLNTARYQQLQDKFHQRESTELQAIKPRSAETAIQATITTAETAVQANYLAVAPDFLRGVEVCAETVLEVVGDKPQKVEWLGYGFYIEVPEGALPPEVTASVGVKVILTGQLKLPETRQLISAIYWVSSSEIFLKEVAVNIQHCAIIRSEEQCSRLSFIIAKCSQKVLPYTFCEQKGLFNSHTQYGAIKLKQFSLIGETAPDDTETLCTAFMYYKQQTTIPVNADFHFVLVTNLPPFIKEVEKEYKDWKKDSNSLRMCFKENMIELDLKEQEVDTWRIVPLTTVQIIKGDVTNFKEGKRIPHCAFELQLLPEKVPNRLFHKVDINGDTSQHFFYIRYEPEVQSSDIVSPSAQPTAPVPLSQKIDFKLDITTLTCLKYEDENGVKRIFIIDDIGSKWKRVGRMLKFTPADIDNIKSSCQGEVESCCEKMLSQWLEGFVVGSSSSITWKTLIEALRDARLGQLADNLKQILSPKP